MICWYANAIGFDTSKIAGLGNFGISTELLVDSSVTKIGGIQVPKP